MTKVRYSATFTLPDGEEFTLTRGSREDYGYTFAWILLAGVDDRLEQGAVIAKGFSRTRPNAESAANAGRKYAPDRVALVAPVTKGGADAQLADDLRIIANHLHDRFDGLVPKAADRVRLAAQRLEDEITEAEVERAAKALKAIAGSRHHTWEETDEPTRAVWRGQARAVLKAARKG
jgi:hypothetical protein